MRNVVQIRPPRERYINGERVPEEQPVLLTGGVLRNYQVDGYQWLQVGVTWCLRDFLLLPILRALTLEY